MLSYFSIKNFAIIKDLEAQFGQGLNILTGETGAGKSIIIEALSMALGSRADTDFIRKGEEKAEINLVMEDKGTEYVLRREINANGKNLCKINGEVVTLANFADFCKGRCDIHGQYDNQTLLNPELHTGLLDLFGGLDLSNVLLETAENFRSLYAISSEIREIKTKLADGERRKDLYTYEIKEIDEASPQKGEDQQLASEIKLMENSEKICSALENAREALFGNYGARDGLGQAMSNLQSFQDVSKEMAEFSQTVSDAYYNIEDLERSLRIYKDSINFSPKEMAEKQERLILIEKLKRKYGGSIDSIYQYRDKISAEAALIENSDSRLADLTKQLQLAKEKYQQSAEKLQQCRMQAGLSMETQINKELSQLNFKNACFKVVLSPCPPSENGSCSAEFLISANKGEDPKPLAKIASGGEISRIMLAIKRITCETDNIPSLIFDEIDAGISGATAGVVGAKLKSISKGRQVICITHLPQIAALADKHFKIQKDVEGEKTFTTLQPLDKDGRIAELARLLSGTQITSAAIAQAKELLKNN